MFKGLSSALISETREVLPERESLNVTSCPHGRGKPQKLTFQVCLQTSEPHINT